MTEFYTYCTNHKNKILYRGYKDGNPVVEKVRFQPTLFYNDPLQTDSEWKSLYGNKPLMKKKFDSMSDANSFINEHSDVEGFDIHGMTWFKYQYISEKFPNDIEYNVSDANILVYDLEVLDPTGEIKGFPDIDKAEVPIVMISFYSTTDKVVRVWGLKDYEKQPDDTFKYKKFEDERTMLNYFIAYLSRTKPDILTGWNTSLFDIPYMVNRMRKIFGEDYTNQISPFDVIEGREVKDDFGNKALEYDIFGVIDLDYLKLYKKFGTYSAKESYKLDYIAGEELGLSKVKMSGRSFYDSYTNHFQEFVKYNAWDTELVIKLDDKMKLIELAFSLSYLYKCNMSDIFRTVLPWEVFIYNHLLKKKIAVPPKNKKDSEAFEGAWVKEAEPNMYGWIMSFDFASLYPSIIRQWNISPETLIDEKIEIGVDAFVNASKEAIEASVRAKELDCAIAANGTMYKKDVLGFLPELMAFLMVGRKTTKKEMLKLEQEYQKTKNASLLPKIAALNNRQMAFKIAANAAYGAIGQKGFLYFNYLMAEAITLTGQVSDRHLADSLNIRMNTLLKTKDVDYITLADTDSVYLNCQPLVDRCCGAMTVDEIVEFLDNFGETECQKVINKSVDYIFDLTNAYDKVMSSKREAIASKTLIRAKKNYAMYVHNSEGVAYNPPKLKILGIEVVRSTTPQWCRAKIKEGIKIMFEKDEKAIQDFFTQCKEEFFKLPVEEIAMNRGVNEISKWMIEKSPYYKSACPIHVRGSILFNMHMANKEWFMPIHNGDKIKMVYLREPNPIRENIIAFPSSETLYEDSGLLQYVDYKLQFEKVFLSPLKSLTDLPKWSLEKRVSLDSFFCDD